MWTILDEYGQLIGDPAGTRTQNYSLGGYRDILFHHGVTHLLEPSHFNEIFLPFHLKSQTLPELVPTKPHTKIRSYSTVSKD